MTTTRIRTYRQDAGTVELFVSDCAHCGIVFGMTSGLEARRRSDGGRFYCPNGHHLTFGESDEDRLRKRAELAERDAAGARRRQGWAEERADRIDLERQAEANRARTLKGHVTRLRNRIATGVCPVQTCRRNFPNVREHIASEHPTWAHEHPDALT